MMEGVNSTMIYCKNICKCHNAPPEHSNMIILKKEKEGPCEKKSFKWSGLLKIYITISLPFKRSISAEQLSSSKANQIKTQLSRF
jgi:hypothetical protein